MDFSDNKAIYLQIADLFLENLLNKVWLPGDRAPSVRELAASTEVNPNTALRVLNHLQELNIIFNKRGLGYFFENEAYEKAKHLKKEEFETIDLPKIFQTMRLLEISGDEIMRKFNHFNQDKK